MKLPARDVEALALRLKRPDLAEQARAARGSKYGARRTEYGGRTYDSAAEAEYAANLDQQRRAGLILGWLPQVPLWTLGGSRYVMDFLVVHRQARPEVVDVKGVETERFKVVWREVRHAHPYLTFTLARRERDGTFTLTHSETEAQP